MANKLGIIAGGGALPGQLIQACRKEGRDVFVVAIIGHAAPEQVSLAPHEWVRLAKPGTAGKLLRQQDVSEIIFAGYVRRPRTLADIVQIGLPDWLAIQFFCSEWRAIFRDSGVIDAIARWIDQKYDARLVGAESVDDTLLASAGVYGRVRPDENAWRDIKVGIQAAHLIGRQDKGQGAIVANGKVVAAEGSDGTDAMIAMAGRRKPNGVGGVLVKVKKPGQEPRIDLPTIGVQTIENAKAAGLRGIAIEAGAALVIDREAVICAADVAGLFVVGVEVPE